MAKLVPGVDYAERVKTSEEIMCVPLQGNGYLKFVSA